MTISKHNRQIGHQPVDLHTVSSLDITRYMGKWYEIARFDHRFEQTMEGVTALYSLQKNGKIRVVNGGYQNGLLNRYRETKGWAKLPNLAEPGHLRVSFYWFFYADYLVLELDEQYRYALVGSDAEGKYLWILSRTPEMAAVDLQYLLERARARGYDTEKLIYVIQ